MFLHVVTVNRTMLKTQRIALFFFLIGFCFMVNGREPIVEFRGDKDVQTNRPIIGILAQDDNGLSKLQSFGNSYIASSYVKYIEAAGARVIPIRNTESKKQLTEIFNSINGVLFPGGAADLYKSKYARTAKLLFDLAVKANDKGDHFPIWATCLGFELLHILVANGKHIPQECDAENYPIPLNFRKDFRKSRLFHSAPDKVVDYLSTLNITMNMHQGCITVKKFNKEKTLKNFFRIISTNMDRKNKVEFVSMDEAINYPFYGSQWHPEKNQFEWTLAEKINHSFEAVVATQYLANFFVNQARMSGHKFPSYKEERKALIFRYEAKPCLEDVTHFDECYFF